MANVTISGNVAAISDKAILLDDELTGIKAWYSRKYCTIMEGHPKRGEWLSLSVPQWLYEKVNGEQSAHAPKSTNDKGGGIPADMLKRLIMLCHPDRHDSSKASTIATQWLLEQRVNLNKRQ